MVPAQSLSHSCSQTMAGPGEILKTSSFTCLAVDAGCWQGSQLELSAGRLTYGLSMWPGFPQSMTAGFQEQVSLERMPGGSSIAFMT